MYELESEVLQMDERKVFPLKLDKELHSKFKSKTAQQGFTMQEKIVEMIEAYVREYDEDDLPF